MPQRAYRALADEPDEHAATRFAERWTVRLRHYVAVDLLAVIQADVEGPGLVLRQFDLSNATRPELRTGRDVHVQAASHHKNPDHHHGRDNEPPDPLRLGLAHALESGRPAGGNARPIRSLSDISAKRVTSSMLAAPTITTDSSEPPPVLALVRWTE